MSVLKAKLFSFDFWTVNCSVYEVL